MYSLFKPFIILLISLFIIRLLVSIIAVARIKGKTGLGSLFYYFNDFFLCVIAFINRYSLLSIKSKSRFLNPISSSVFPALKLSHLCLLV
jgi:hypothetical protein